MIIRIFATSVLAKPLNNAQIVRGVFCLCKLYLAALHRPAQKPYELEHAGLRRLHLAHLHQHSRRCHDHGPRMLYGMHRTHHRDLGQLSEPNRRQCLQPMHLTDHRGMQGRQSAPLRFGRIYGSTHRRSHPVCAGWLRRLLQRQQPLALFRTDQVA